ncbi:serine/threonine protein kinase [Actinomadura barringtoniae]|uniref:Serine/threonine protein kinase n=1 Tax=Actinomadura barringtoniae TaxID=1427535 RepID=A0A939PJ82_9ACTN|nr:serine/threonine-protein kinase [Actinomadura barringtoniae]MBO2453912.1 serine/threonine protein kinase [Actinomadura barringtoniae]
MPDAAPLEPGDPRALGQYEVVGRLGAGGQGAVFLGKSAGGEYVAVKLLHAQMATDPSARARFSREVAAAQKVEPFCTARVIEADVQGDQPYVVSEFIDGPSLHDVVAHDGPRGAAELERLAIGTVTALAAIHEAGIVHRDFKPNNVMLASDGPRVVDFGIARTVNSQESAVTATGMVVGTPGYLAPEQLTGAPLTPAVDIFAWGATMVFAATGQSPFEADTLPVIINRILNEEPDLSALPAGPLRDLVGRCLSKDAGLRPPAPQLLFNLLGHVGAAPSNPSAGQEALLNQGTRIAAQMPAPPQVPPVRQHTPPPQPITPPPMPMGGGPHTPPPQPITPPPMPMYQGGMQQPPPPPQMVAGGGYPPPRPPQYGPPPRQGGSNTGAVVGIGCAVLAVIAIIVVIVVIAVNAGDDNPTPRRFTYSPTYTYSPPSGLPSSGTIGDGLTGIYKGYGNQPNAGTGRTSFKANFYFYGTRGSAIYTYTDTPACFTSLSLLNKDGDKLIWRETSTSSDPSRCASGYITFTPTASGATARWEWRPTQSTASATAFGTVVKN